MRFSHDDMRQGAAQSIRATAGRVPPPPVLTTVLALSRDQALDHVIASFEPSDEGTSWHIVAIVGQALLTVDASSPTTDWALENPGVGETLAVDDRLDARLRRLADIASIQVLRTTNFDTFGEWTFNGQWRLTMRDSTEVDIRASRDTSAVREACDALALHLIDAMRDGPGA